MIHETALQVGAFVGTAGVAGIGADAIINEGDKIASLGTAGILGVVSLACVCALVKLYREKTADAKDYNDKLYSLIESNTQLNTQFKDAVKDMTDSVKQVSNQVAKCNAGK